MAGQNKFRGVLRRSAKSGRPTKAVSANRRSTRKGRGRKRTAYQIFANARLKKYGGGPVAMKRIGREWNAQQNRRKRGGKRKANPANRRKRGGKRNTWPGHSAGHATASRKGWGKRKRGASGYKKPHFPRAANKKRKGRGKRRANPANRRMKFWANPMKKLGGYVVEMKSAGAVADIKAHPVPHVAGGLLGAVSSSVIGGGFRAGIGGKYGERAGDIASFVGNVVGTELPAMAVAYIGKATKHDQTGRRIARGMRWGGYIALAVNVVATVIKWATKSKGKMSQPVLPWFKEGKYLSGVRVGVKEWGLQGLGLNFANPFRKGASAEMRALAAAYGLSEDEVFAAMGHTDTPRDYGLSQSEYETQLDAELAALAAEGDKDALAQTARGVGLDENEEAQIYGLY